MHRLLGLSLALAMGLLLSVRSSAQAPTSAEVERFVSEASGRVIERAGTMPGSRYVRPASACAGHPLEWWCPLPNSLPPARLRELQPAFARGIGALVPTAPTTEQLVAARVANRARLQDGGSVARCGSSDPADYWVIYQLAQLAIDDDRMRAVIYITHASPIAGCAAGLTIWSATATRTDAGFALGPLREGAHFELQLDDEHQRR